MKFSFILLLLLSSQAFAKWSLTTYNIRNFDRDSQAGQTNITELEKILRNAKSDVMGFQEVVNVSAFEKVIKRVFPSYQLVKSNCGGGGKQKLAIAFNAERFELNGTREDYRFSSEYEACGSLRPAFLVFLREKKTQKRFVFANLHLKAGSDDRAYQTRWEQYKLLETLSREHEGATLVMMGDLNTTGYNIKNEDYRRFENFLSASDFRTVSEDIGCTSYWHGADQDPNYEPSTLDHVVVPSALYSKVLSVKVSSHCQKVSCLSVPYQDLGVSYDAVSDHCPIQVTFK